MKNRYGLSRNIPADTKRLVRQDCGYGCIICGAAIIEYEHIDPPFPEAEAHNPSGIGLLCPQCHAKVTRGFLSKQAVKQARLDPFCKQRGFANEFFDIGRTYPRLTFAGSTVTRTPIPVMVEGVPLIRVDPAEEDSGPFRLTGNFYNSQGVLSLEIVANEWRARSANWDVEAIGGVITVRDNPRHISLQLRAVPPDGLEVERLDMFVRNWRILGNKRELVVESPDGRRNTFSGCLGDGAEVGFMLG